MSSEREIGSDEKKDPRSQPMKRKVAAIAILATKKKFAQFPTFFSPFLSFSFVHFFSLSLSLITAITWLALAASSSSMKLHT